MMKLWRKIATITLAGILTFCCAMPVMPNQCMQVQAAETYTYKTDKDNKTFKDASTIKVEHYYKRVVLNGSSKAIKSINKQLKAYSDQFMKQKSAAFDYAANDCKISNCDTTYVDFVKQKVSFRSDKIVCIYTKSEWWAGGVSNTDEYGYTFNLKTGKLIKKITSVTKTSSLSKIKAKLKKSIKADQYDASELDEMGAADFRYYINSKGNVVVCFAPYELGYGGWCKKYTLKGKYAK